MNNVPIFSSPGAFTRISTYLSTNTAETKDNHSFAELETPVLDLTSATLFDKTISAIKTAGWEIIDTNQDNLTIDAVITTSLWRFQDDIHIQIEEIKPEQSSLNIVSKSRVGKGDFGANAGHILYLIKLLDEKS
jgi:uncharacterized protein (DUF1499 family)